MALYLGHLASTGRSIATVQQARSAISHFHAAAGMQKGDNPALHPVVSEAVKGWRNRAPAPRQAGALTADALARVREVLRLPKRSRGGRMESADTARRRAALDLAIIGVLADGGLRRSEAAALTWGDVELWADGSGRLTSIRARTRSNRPRWRSPRQPLSRAEGCVESYRRDYPGLNSGGREVGRRSAGALGGAGGGLRWALGTRREQRTR